MSSLRKLKRSVIMHESYKQCGSSAMFGSLWNKHHYKNDVKMIQSNVDNKKQIKKDKGFLSKFRKYLLGKKNRITAAASN